MSDREKAIRRRLKDDFPHYAERCLKIRTKEGAVQSFRLNTAQRRLHERLEEQRAATGRVRAIVLKGRQVGISTYVAGRFYWRVTHRRGVRAFILAHLDTASDNLFGFAKRFHEHCPPLVRPATGKANAKELSFSGLDSGYKVATAGSAEVGRSETIQYFHGSEVGFWPNAEIHAAGILQAIADVPESEMIFESTANGISNAFYALWTAAERGDNDLLPIFVPWFWHEEYATEPPVDWQPPLAWAEYGEQLALTPAQLYWAWLKNRQLAATAGGTSDEPCWQFRQEYPGTAAEAFQTGGNSFIPAESVMRARKASVEGYGPIILGVDPARNKGAGDKVGLVDRQGRRLGGHVCRRLATDDTMAIVGEVIRLIAELKPKGLRKVVVDITGLGSGVYDRLREQVGDLVDPVNFGAKALDTVKYANRRAEIWDLQRQWLDDPAGVQIPDSDELQGDLCAPVRGAGATRFNSVGQLILEDKDHIRQRVKFSPDLGDAGALTHAVDYSQFDGVDWSDSGESRGGEGAWLGM